MPNINVHSGEIGFSGKPDITMHTVVGVCIAVILWDKVNRRGGMCHYRLPVAGSSTDFLNRYDFGSEAIISLLKRFKESGSLVDQIEARIIGGGDIHYGSYMENQKIGYHNTRVASALLNHFSIPVKGKVVGGAYGRQIRFDVYSGEVNFKEFVCDGIDEERQLFFKKDNVPISPSTMDERVDEYILNLSSEGKLSNLDSNKIDLKLQLPKKYHRLALILIGSSTGGVEALSTIIKRLPSKTPPICIVQHIPKDYSNSLAQNLNKDGLLTVFEATDGMELEDSCVYVAPGDRHLKIVQLTDGRLIARLSDDPELNGFKPSIDFLFKSAVKIKSRKIAAALLTGMGTDGAKGLLQLKEKGAYTVAQDRNSSVVWGMAGEAVKIGASCRTAPLISIANILMESLK